MSMRWRVRRAEPTPHDVATLTRLLTAFDDEFDAPHDSATILAGRFERLLRGPHAFALLGSPAHALAPAGFALVTLRPVIWFDGPLATLDELYVAPDHRGQGLGSEMFAAMRHELVARGCEELHVNVDEVDEGARRFYESQGLVNVERAEDGRMLLFTGPVDPGPEAA